MIIWLVSFLILVGSFFGFVAALGVFRMPDLFIRMHAATKAGAFGAALMLLAFGLYFGSAKAWIFSLVIIVFFYLTTPVAAQAIARAAYRKGVPFWEKMGVDRLEESGEIPERSKSDEDQ
ncbi:MAG: monovalent cation/H(+) antiporter subunit G [Puniceicoccales bacterium]